ncbi:MAG: hypothetical protein M1834_009274 [Cirrosporium novae-zelandiae]|nr:MAG: hypothetical protein M1834_009274 [Cirrosporium novae-zelandiae]
MFRFHKTLDVVTLFHKPTLPTSTRVLTLLKQASAQASDYATEDQASDHSHHNKVQRAGFELNVTEDAPTSDQLRTILQYVGAGRVGELVKGARNEPDALRKLKESGENFQRPVTVDWNNGKADISFIAMEIVGNNRKVRGLFKDDARDTIGPKMVENSFLRLEQHPFEKISYTIFCASCGAKGKL